MPISPSLSARIDGSNLLLSVQVASLDATTARSMRQEIDDLWREEIISIEMDLSQVEFIDSSGVGALLYISKKLTPQRGRLRLVKIPPVVREVIELLRLQSVFLMG